MNLIDDEVATKQNKKRNIIMIVIFVLIILLLCLCAGIVYLIYDIQNSTEKLVIDGVSTSFSSDMFLHEDDTIYVSIKDFAVLVGYEVYNGDHTSEDSTMGYIQNSYEEASYTLNSNKIYKNLLDTTDYEYYDIEEPVKIENDKLYMSIDGIQIATTCSISYSESTNQYTVYTLEYLTSVYIENYTNVALGKEYGDDYTNQKALLYDMVVVQNTNEYYGVNSVDGTEIIGTKYKAIEFVESSNEFIVTTSDGKMGILTSTGETKISPNYDSIDQLDKDLKLYVVEKNDKYGVINESGTIIIYLEYDQIGVSASDFVGDNVKNKYLLFDNCIPVERDDKWGFFDVSGNQLTSLDYDGVGCAVGSKSYSSASNLLIIPEYEAIIVKQDKLYGLIYATGEELLPCQLDSFYSLTTSGEDVYYMVQDKITVEVIEYLTEELGIEPVTTVTGGEEIENTLNGTTIEENEVTDSNTE